MIAAMLHPFRWTRLFFQAMEGTLETLPRIEPTEPTHMEEWERAREAAGNDFYSLDDNEEEFLGYDD